MARIDLDNIIGDPFALITISVGIIGWIMSFVSCIIIDVNTSFPNYSWWAVGFMFVIIIGVIYVFGSNTAHVYGIAVVGFVSSAFVFTTLSVNNLIYQKKSSQEAASAGFILLCAVDALWIFYFGSAPFSGARRVIDSYSNKQYPSYGGGSAMKPAGTTVTAARYSMPETTTHQHDLSNLRSSGWEDSRAFTNSWNDSHPYFNTNESHDMSREPSMLPQPTSHTPGAEEEDVPEPATYPYRAKAIYTYEANPEDANEIGFMKNEILEVSDVSGRWWQARRSNGETGIAPSNYLILL